MKQIVGAVLVVLLLAGAVAAAEKKIELQSNMDKVSYAIGMRIGRDFASQKIDVDPDILARGIKDAMAGGDVLLTDEEAQAAMMAFQQEMTAARESEMKVVGEKNAKAGEAFLTENAKKEGVVSLPSGLQYKIITEGAGNMPSKDDTVTVNYRGTLIDGKEFDSSYKRGEPATFPVNGVIPGWTEALQLMKEGAKWQLYIPAALAYGTRSAGPAIGPNSTLVFEVELISIKQ